MKVHIVKTTNMILFQLLTIVTSFPHRGTIGPSGFEIMTRSPYIPDAYYNYRQYNDGRLEKPAKTHNVQNFEKDFEMFNQAVVNKDDDDKPKYKEIHFEDGVNSMIMDIKMPPHYHFRQGLNNMYNFDLNKIVRQMSSTASNEFHLHKGLTIKIQQKHNPKQNMNYNENVNLAKFFSSGRDNVDYGYSLDSVGSTMIKDDFNSLSRLDKGDDMNINFMSTERTQDAEPAGRYKIPTYIESTENIEFSSNTASYDPYTTEEGDIGDRTHYSAPVVASLLGGG